MKIVLYSGLLVLIFYILLFAWLSFLSLKGRQPGMETGQLKPCPGTPNCVCSEYENGAWYIQPFDFDEPPMNAWSKLKSAVTSSGGQIQEATENYMWCTFKTRLFRFTDDVEFRLDANARRIEVRSASRVGKGDFGANRKRIEKLRKLFNSSNKA